MLIETTNNELATFKKNETEIAYLNSKFDKKIVNKIIKYEIKNGVNSYHLAIEIIRDPVTEELFIEIRDELMEFMLTNMLRFDERWKNEI